MPSPATAQMSGQQLGWAVFEPTHFCWSRKAEATWRSENRLGVGQNGLKRGTIKWTAQLPESKQRKATAESQNAHAMSAASAVAEKPDHSYTKAGVLSHTGLAQRRFF